MTTTVKELADTNNISVDILIKRLDMAGITGKSATDTLSEDEKKALSAVPANKSSKLSLKRTTTSTLSQGRGVNTSKKGVSVAVRKKKTFTRKPVVRQQEVDVDKLRKRQEILEKRKTEQARLSDLENARRQAHLEKRQKAEEAELLKKQAEEERVRLAKEAQTKKEIEERQKQAVANGEGKSDKKKQPKRKKHGPSAREELHIKKGSGKRRKNKPVKDEGKKVTISTASEHGFTKPTEPVKLEISVPETITVGDLAKKMFIKAADLLKVMMSNGIMATINQTIDQDTACLLVEEMGHTSLAVTDTTLEDKISRETGDQMEGVPTESRPAVVTIMGHVDHGKTSLLDYIRNTQVTKDEAGGITQHIGAYKVATENGEITFLDTPGHAAFTAMRARGARVTDIVIIVVGADDGVMPQTIEAIEHAKAAAVPIIVAMNKMDKPEADPDKIKNEMSKYELVSEDWGGDVAFVPISAQTGQGVDELLEAILLNAEILELKAPTITKAKGTVIESRVDKGRGTIVSVMVQSGILKKGDMVLSGREFGRIRGMIDGKGQNINEAKPSTPVEILGLSGTPEAGADLIVVEKERQARELAEERNAKYRDLKLAQQKQAGLDRMFTQMQEEGLSEVNVLVKSDVHGSSEAIRESLIKISNDEVKVNVVSSGVGGINESDANLALASSAIIVGFNVRANASAKKIIDKENIDLQYFSVIYDLIDQVKKLVLGEMRPEFKENIVGLAEVRDVFKAPKIGAIAGCIVTEGTIKRNNPIRVLRDDVVIFEGELESLRRFKDNVNEVKSGTECGIGVKSYNDVKVGDQIEVFELIEVAKTL